MHRQRWQSQADAVRARAEALANKPHMLLIIRVLVLLLKLWLHSVQRTTSAEGVGAQRTSAQRVGAQRSALQHELSLITLWLWRAPVQHVAVQALGWGSR